MSTPTFDDAVALAPTGAGRFDGVLTREWTIGPKAHGGVLLALCARAARLVAPEPGQAPLAVSASYLRAPEPGPVQLVATVVKQGRSVSVVDVELLQGDRPAVRATVTLGAPDPQAPEAPAAATAQPVAPPPDAIDLGAHPTSSGLLLYTACEVRMDPVSAPYLAGRAEPGVHARLWVRPRGTEPDTMFALFAGDVGPPVTLNLGRLGWAPTVQLTALLRGDPAPGWLRVQMASAAVGDAWFDEDATVLDSAGRLVCQTRQLALAPLR